MILIVSCTGELIINPNFFRVNETLFKQSFLEITTATGTEVRVTPGITKEFAFELLNELTDRTIQAVQTREYLFIDYRETDFSRYITDKIIE